jgi:hypothetical protein
MTPRLHRAALSQRFAFQDDSFRNESPCKKIALQRIAVETNVPGATF